MRAATVLTCGALLLATAARVSAQGEQEKSFVKSSGTSIYLFGGSSIAFSRDRKFLAVGDFEDGTISLREIPSGRIVRSLAQPEKGTVVFLAFRENDQVLESQTLHSTPLGPSSRTIRLWQVSTGKQSFAKTLPGNWRGPGHAAFSPDGKSFAISSGDSTVTVWDVATDKKRRDREWKGQDVVGFSFTSDARLLVTTVENDTMARHPTRIWDMELQKPVLEPPYFVIGPISSDGRHSAGLTGGPCIGGILLLFDLQTKKVGPLIIGGMIPVAGGAVFSADNMYLASGSGSHDGSEASPYIELWQVPAGKRIVRLQPPGDPKADWREASLTVTFSPDGKMLAFCTDKSCVVQQLSHLSGFGGTVSLLGFSSDAKLMAVGHDNGLVQVVEVANDKKVREFKGHGKRIEAVAISPDKELIASAAEDGVRISSVRDGRLHHHLKVQDDRLLSLDFAPPNTSLFKLDRKQIRTLAFCENRFLAMTRAGFDSHYWDVRSGLEMGPRGAPE